jgi:glycosyltransferase involved in cell wall biosynthesis
MRVLLLSRATLFSNPGGDTIQVTRTAEYLRKLGVEAEVRLANQKINYSGYDLIHFFNIIRPADILHHAKKSGKPYVVSTIFVDYSEFEQKNSGRMRRFISRFLPFDMIEYLKVWGRFIKNGEKIGSIYYLMHGHKRSVQKVISEAAMLLPNSQNEYKRLRERYKIERPYMVVPNGIDPTVFLGIGGSPLRNNDYVLCVARIEPFKNQLNLIKALRNTSFRLYIIGRPSVNHKKYYLACKREAGSNVQFIEYMPQKELLQYYKEAKVHALPSWFETTGLSSLESAVSGCNIVITDKGDTREYFGDFAYYCNPASLESLLNAVTMASRDPVNPAFSKYVAAHFTWEIAASKTSAVYKKISNKQQK